MPRCQSCGKSVSSDTLRKVDTAVVCAVCGRPKPVEGKMSEEKKRVLSVVLSEVPTDDEAVDHEVMVESSYGGLDIKFNTTFDKVRDFFTQKREKGKKALSE